MLNDEEILFLEESNRIEGLNSLIYNVDSYIGHAAAWILFREKAEKSERLGLEDICEAQKLLMNEQEELKFVPENLRGVLRNSENRHNVYIEGREDIRLPHYEKVPELMERYMEKLWSFMSKKLLDPVDLAAVFHRKFERIHPFADGNGRTGRLIANYVMRYFGEDIIIFTSHDRQDYYSCFDSDSLIIDYFRRKKEQE